MNTETTPDILKLATLLTNAASVAADAKSADDYKYIVVPQGYKVEDITAAVEKANPVAYRKRGRVELKDLASLAEYCKDQSAAATAYIYADPDQRSITAVFNDYKGDEAGWRDHRAVYKAEYTKEFTKWLERNGHSFTQTEFAEFIEDNFADLQGEHAPVLLEVATTLQAKTDINFSSAKRLQNGQSQLQYTENIDARAGANGALEIPKEFTLGIRIFKNGAGYKIKARLKYRLHAGGVKFFYELDRPERAIEDAFAGYVQTLRETTGHTVLLGAAA
jgi:uncharacterized protein YfdQ (DUF2303 family)